MGCEVGGKSLVLKYVQLENNQMGLREFYHLGEKYSQSLSRVSNSAVHMLEV